MNERCSMCTEQSRATKKAYGSCKHAICFLRGELTDFGGYLSNQIKSREGGDSSASGANFRSAGCTCTY